MGKTEECTCMHDGWTVPSFQSKDDDKLKEGFLSRIKYTTRSTKVCCCLSPSPSLSLYLSLSLSSCSSCFCFLYRYSSKKLCHCGVQIPTSILQCFLCRLLVKAHLEQCPHILVPKSRARVGLCPLLSSTLKCLVVVQVLLR